MTGWPPSNFKLFMPINITRVTRYVDPPDISMIFKREHNWQDPTCSEGRLEDLMTNDFGLGGSGAWSPTFMAHFNSMSEPRPWILTSSDAQLIGSESCSSYTAYVEGIPHEDRPPTYDSLASSGLGQFLGVRLDKDLQKPVMEDNLLTAESCNLLTSCCTLSLDIYYSDTITFVLRGLLKDVTIFSDDKSFLHTSQDQRRLGSRFDKLMLTFIPVRNSFLYQNFT